MLFRCGLFVLGLAWLSGCGGKILDETADDLHDGGSTHRGSLDGASHGTADASRGNGLPGSGGNGGTGTLPGFPGFGGDGGPGGFPGFAFGDAGFGGFPGFGRDGGGFAG